MYNNYMTYAEYITKLRNQVGDTREHVHVDWTGDGQTTVFQMPTDTFPILDDSTTYTFKVNGIALTEVAQFTIDKDAGTITVTSTPGSNVAISLDAVKVYLKDSDWLGVINDTIKSLGDDFWKEFVDTTLTGTVGSLEADISVIKPKCIAIYDFMARAASTDDYKSVSTYTNWRYDRDNNKIYVGRVDTFSIIGSQLKIRGLEGYTLGDSTDDNIDVQDRFMTIIEYGCIARYWRWRYKSVIELVSKMTQESSRTPLQELMMLSDRFDRLYESEKARLKPQKPAKIIPLYNRNGGRA